MQFIDVKNQTLVLAQTDIPQPTPNQCLVKVNAIGVNRADILQRQGKYPPTAGESAILGLEIAGEIVQCSPQNKAFKLGDRVCGLVSGGGYAEYAVVNHQQLIKLPEHFSYEQGAATAEVFLTAYQSLFTIARLQPNASVLIHAGASGVGSAAIQLAKALNCFVVTTAGSEVKIEACKQLGADIALNYNDIHFAQWAKANKRKFDVIIDVVAGDYIEENINVAALDGHLVILAMLGGRYTPKLDVARLLQKRLTITASTLRNRSDKYKGELVRAFTQQFYASLVNETIKPVIHACYPWQEAELAHQCMMSNSNIGKLILTVER